MVINDPVPTQFRRISKRKSGASVHAAMTAVTAPQPLETYQPVFTQAPVAAVEVEDEAESSRVFKKRRTSSDAPEEAEDERPWAKYIDDEPEADPNGDQWEDLDEEDADDPLMVSEYVNDIFNYFKSIEVKRVLHRDKQRLNPSPTANDHAKPQLYGSPKGACVEDARNLDRLAHPSPRPLSLTP
jgi:hypothetical protein